MPVFSLALVEVLGQVKLCLQLVKRVVPGDDVGAAGGDPVIE